MTTHFDASRGLIVIDVRVWGPAGSSVLQMALDTGASSSMINLGRLEAMGYSKARASGRTTVTTASGSEHASWIDVNSVEALGLRHDRFRILAYTLPPETGVDGLLGLDFFRDRRLAIDFRKSTVQIR